MRRLLSCCGTAIVVLLLGMFIPNAAASSKSVSLYDGAVTLELPDALTVMDPEMIRIKYPHEGRPKHIYGNADGNVSVAVDMKGTDLVIEQLPELQEAMEEMLPRIIPNLKWVAKRVMTINDRKWLLLEFRSTAIDSDIHNITLTTSFRGKLLRFNFNSTMEEYEAQKAALLKSIQSIRVRE